MKPSCSEFIQIRTLQYHVRKWGNPNAPKLFMLHGWMDVSASFQFVIDCLLQDWHVIAPDWRGFGLTKGGAVDHYWFPDYIGDLDAILQYYSPSSAVNLLGHSMGGNIACIYAGVRPERVRNIINLEGFGMPSTRAEDAPGRYARWLTDLRHPPTMRTYSSQAEVAVRLQKNNKRLTDERATFLARYWSRQNAQGRWEILGDPAHKIVSPLLYQVEEVLACWRAITAPVLWVEAVESDVWRWLGPESQVRSEIDRRKKNIPSVVTATLSDAGHMLHHDQPEILAQHIEQFLI